MAEYGKDSTLADLKKIFSEAKANRDRLEPEWFLCVAYYLGEQWLWWNRGRLDRPQLEDWRVTLVDNRILPAVSSRVARKLKSRPTFVVTPNTYDDKDLDAAQLGEEVMANDWVEMFLGSKLLQAMMWQEVTGAGFWKIYWDKSQGNKTPYVFDQEGNPQLNNGRPIPADTFDNGVPDGLVTKDISMGDVKVDVLSPFEIFPDPLATELNECEYIIEEKVRSKEYVKKKFDFDAKEDADAPVGIVESRLIGFTNLGDTRAKGVTVKEMWMPPSSKEKKGKWCAWVDEKVLVEETLDEAPFDGNPYIMFSGPTVPGRFWPTSITSQLRGPQTELNKIKSQISENASRIGNPALLRSRTAGVEYSGVPGEDVLYDDTTPNSIPSYLVPPEVPGYVREQIDRIQDSITEITGLHEVSKATVPSGVTAASAIQLLQEADDTRLGPEVEDMELSLGQAGTKILKLRAKYQSDQRFLRTAGEDGEWNINEFRGQMLTNTTVEVQAGSMMPRSKAAKQAAMQDVFNLIMQYGVQVDPRDLRKFFKDYEVGGIERLFADIQGDELQVKREHNIMYGGKAVDINVDFDDHEFHIAAHNESRKTRKYMQASDEIKEFIDTHVKAHQEAVVTKTDLQLKATGEPNVPEQNGASQPAPQESER